MRTSLLLLATLAAAPALASPQPMTTCSEAWEQRYGMTTQLNYQLQVDDPAAVLRTIRAELERAGAVITQRSEANGTHQLTASLPEPMDLVARLDKFEPVWQREQETRRQQNVAEQCHQLHAARNVADRLEAWLTEAMPPPEQQAVLTMYQTHLRQVQNLDTQLRRIESNRTPHQLQLQLTQKPPGPTAKRK